ncbi:MAG: hypothetical protein H0W83_03370 [Planctomycetes bacterium]|nr:hypothetical protein [Planctomycetota bacterium]
MSTGSHIAGTTYPRITIGEPGLYTWLIGQGFPTQVELTAQNSGAANTTGTTRVSASTENWEKRFTPRIISIPPSWQVDPSNVAVKIEDEALRNLNSAESGGSPFISIGNDHENAIGSGNTATATLKIGRSNNDGGSAPTALKQTSGRKYASYGFSAGDGYSYGVSAPVNLIRLTPDVVATGTRSTIRVEANFINRDFDCDTDGEFSKEAGDYVRFLKQGGGQDITQVRSAWSDSQDPAERKGKIAIVGQKLIVDGEFQARNQIIEMEVEIGPEVEAALYDVDVKCGAVKAYSDELSQLTAGANGAHRMKGALAICRINVNPIELWQLEDKEYTIRVAGKESAGSQPAANENVWIDVALPQFTDAEAKAKVKAWTLNWTGMEPHCFYLNQGSGAFVKQSNQGKIAVDDAKARFLGGMAGDAPEEALQSAGFSNYYFTIDDPIFNELGLGDYLLGMVEVKHRELEQTLAEDNDFAKAPYGGTSLFGNRATIAFTDAGPRPIVKPSSGLTGANTKFAVKYDVAMTATGQDPAVAGDGSNQAAPILSWPDGSSFVVAGDRVGDTIVQVFPVFGGNPDTSAALLEIPVQVDLPVLSEPGVYQLEVARRNLELRKNFSGDGELQQESTPIPPANGGTDNDWKLPTGYTVPWGAQHAARTKNTDDLDTVFEFCMHMVAQIVPVFPNGEGAWHLPVSRAESLSQIKQTQTDSSQAAYELALDQYRRMWNSGTDCDDAAVAQRLQKSGPPLQQWLRVFKHFVTNGVRAERADPAMERTRRLLEVKLRSYMDQAAIARLKRYFSLTADYRQTLLATPIAIDGVKDTVIANQMNHQGGFELNPDLAWWLDVKTWFTDTFFHTGPLTRLFDKPITPNWHVGHPFTEEVLNYMITERVSWVQKLLKEIEQRGCQPGEDNYPITVAKIDSGDFVPMSKIPIGYIFDATDKRIRFVVPERFWARDSQFAYPRFRGRNGVPVPEIVLLDASVGADGTIGRGSPDGFRLRVQTQHLNFSAYDLELRADPLSPAGTPAAIVIRLMGEVHVIERMLDDRAALIFWQNAEAHMGKLGFLAFCVGDFLGASTDIYRTVWGRDLVTDQQLTIEERLMSGMMVGVTVLTGGVPGSALVGKGIKVMSKDISKNVAKTAQSNMVGMSQEVRTAVGDMSQGGVEVAEATANTARRTAARSTSLSRTALEAGLLNVDSILKLPVQDFLKFHCGLGRLGETTIVRSGSQAPHINPLCGLEKSAKRPVPRPSAVRAAPTAKTSDATIGAAEDAAMASRTIATMKAAGASEKATCDMVNGLQQCFPAGTSVLMGDGSWKAIESVTQGQEVMSRNQWDPDSARIARAVSGSMVSDVEALTTLGLETGDGRRFDIRSTTEHPFWVQGEGWTSAKDIAVGVCLAGGDEPLTVVANTSQAVDVKVYNLEIVADRTYFVSSMSPRGPPCGVWVHNNCVLRASLEQYVRREASALGVQLTDKQVLEGAQILVQRAAIRGGRKLLLPLRNIADPDISRVLSQFVEGVPGMIHLGRKRIAFQGLEVRAARSFETLSEADLRVMKTNGTAPVFPDGTTLQVHHHRQNPLGFVVEIKADNHSIWNTLQHPFGNVPGGGLTSMERQEFDNWLGRYWRARAKEALISRGLAP